MCAAASSCSVRMITPRRSVTVWRFIIKKQNRSRGFYEARGILKTVEDQSTVDGTTQAILEALGR